MKRAGLILFLLVMAAGFCAAAAVDLTLYPERKCFAAGGTAEITPEFDAIQLTWDPSARKFMEFSFLRPVYIGKFDTLTVTVNLKKSAKSTLSVLSLRLRDKAGEVFQFSHDVKPDTEKLVYKIDGANPKPNGCWKGSASAVSDRKLDFPLELTGMAIHFPDGSEAGEVKITSIVIDKFPEVPEPVNAKESVPVSGKIFKVKNDGGKSVFEYPEGINFPVLRGGQFRLRLKSAAVPDAKLFLLLKKQEKVQSAAKTEKETDNVYSLIYVVPYELDGQAVSLKRITAGAGAEIVDITYEMPHVKLAFDFGAGSDFYAWRKGTTGKILLSNHRNIPAEGRVDLVFSDNAGKEIRRIVKDIKLAPGGTDEISLPEPELFGLYHVEGVLPGRNGHPVAFSRRIGFMPANNPAEHGSMQYGIALLTPALPRLEVSARAARFCGADFDRSSIIWGFLERQPGVWDWSYPDAHSKILKKANLRWAPILWYPPRWATAKNWQPSYTPVMKRLGFPMPEIEHWKNYVRLSVERYGKENIRVMEIWNEPELPGFANFTPEEYAELLKSAYDVIKSVNPAIKVSACGYTCMPGEHPRMTFPDFMPRSLKAAQGKYDYHPIHYHGFFHEYASGIGAFLNSRKEWGITVPWAANETAMTSSFCSRQTQAEVLFEKMVYSQAKGAAAHVWHNMYDLGRDSFNKEHNFGLLDNAMQPKEAYLAYNNVTELFRGAVPEKELIWDDCYIFMFKKGRSVLIPCWTLYPPVSEKLIEFSGVTGRAELVDLFGNRTPVKTSGGKLLLHVSSAPATLIIEQEKLPEITGEIFRSTRNSGEFKLMPGSAVRTVSGALAGRKPENLKIASDGTFRCDVNSSDFRKLKSLVLNFDTDFGRFSVSRYLMPQFTFASKADFNRAADFAMLDSSSYMQTSPNDPQYADCFYKGAEDCSVRVWLGWEKPETVVLKVVVHDDIHYQDKSGKQIYQGDGLQIFFSHTAVGGMWKIGIARDNDGNIQKCCWITPGKDSGDDLLAAIPVRIERDENKKDTVYEMKFPAKQLGIEQGKSFRFNLLVNDNDGRCRVGYHSITEVRGEGKNDIGYPGVVFEK